MNLRPYQERCVDYLTPRRRALCIVPAGGGKTVIAAAALAKLQVWEAFAWLANTREQVDQAAAACKAAGVSPEWIRCVAGLDPATDLKGLSCIVIDECHHAASAATWQAIFAYAPTDCRVWGFTATPPDNIDLMRFWHSLWPDGQVKVERAELLDAGNLAKGHVIVLDLDEPGEFNEIIKAAAQIESLKMLRRYPFLGRTENGKQKIEARATWRVTLDLLLNNPVRHAAVVAIATEHAGASVLILVAEIAQGERLALEIPGAELVNAKLPVKKRRDILARFKSGELKCLVATSLADEGFDAPIASVLILATYGKSAGKLEQRTGRVLRAYPGKDYGLIYDFADRGAGMALSQARKRALVYRRLGYSMEFQKP